MWQLIWFIRLAFVCIPLFLRPTTECKRKIHGDATSWSERSRERAIKEGGERERKAKQALLWKERMDEWIASIHWSSDWITPFLVLKAEKQIWFVVVRIVYNTIVLWMKNTFTTSTCVAICLFRENVRIFCLIAIGPNRFRVHRSVFIFNFIQNASVTFAVKFIRWGRFSRTDFLAKQH